MKKFTSATATKWFYEPVHPLLRVAQIYVKGDALVIIPFLICTLLIGFVFSWPMVWFMLSVFYAVRQLGELVYWLFQQFHDHSYRPYDFGLSLLSTHSIYILYQVSACVQATIGISLACYVYISYLV